MRIRYGLKDLIVNKFNMERVWLNSKRF
jgi:hypothetical protein